MFLTNRAIPTQEGEILARTLSLVLGRWTSGGVHEDLDLTNHGALPVRFNLELSIRADFADIFEIKTGRFVRRGRITTEWSDLAQTLNTTYTNLDFRRGIRMTVRSETTAVDANGRISFDIMLNPGASWHACLLTEIIDGVETAASPQTCIADATSSEAAASLATWRALTATLATSNISFARQFDQAVSDMAALRLPMDGAVLPAAGLPWFLAPFGRDSIIAALQTLPFNQEFARGALAILGARQCRERDDARDAEPGKILHEERLGELAHFKLIPHTPYFGTADATPLYLVLLAETWRWTGDTTLLAQHMDTAERCLQWIDADGDRDGDGFQEYATRAAHGGYENMAWKDAGDAVLYIDGTRVRGPKALCELQGYVYAAWQGMAALHDHLGNTARAAELRAKAAKLYNDFNDRFWNDTIGAYAFALDGDKRQVMTTVSNIGHCLWSGIIRPDRARRVVETLMAPDMFSGWGIRTRSAKHAAYNPFSYHNGSVWPHDNGLIAQGFRRYGFTAEAATVARAISDAASFFAQHQIPELFSGIHRNGTDFPVQCLGANVPQAWAAGATFSFLQALIGFNPDGQSGTLTIDPALPDWLPDLTLANIRCGEKQFSFKIREQGVLF